jgi:hypothetical protein
VPTPLAGPSPRRIGWFRVAVTFFPSGQTPRPRILW